MAHKNGSMFLLKRFRRFQPRCMLCVYLRISNSVDHKVPPKRQAARHFLPECSAICITLLGLSLDLRQSISRRRDGGLELCTLQSATTVSDRKLHLACHPLTCTTFGPLAKMCAKPLSLHTLLCVCVMQMFCTLLITERSFPQS